MLNQIALDSYKCRIPPISLRSRFPHDYRLCTFNFNIIVPVKDVRIEVSKLGESN